MWVRLRGCCVGAPRGAVCAAPRDWAGASSLSSARSAGCISGERRAVAAGFEGFFSSPGWSRGLRFGLRAMKRDQKRLDLPEREIWQLVGTQFCEVNELRPTRCWKSVEKATHKQSARRRRPAALQNTRDFAHSLCTGICRLAAGFRGLAACRHTGCEVNELRPDTLPGG